MSNLLSGRRLAWLIASCSVGLFAANANAQSGDAIQWSVTPYIWASDTSVDLTFRDTNIGAGDITFGDLMEVLDAAFMLHIENGGGNWSTFGDFTYLDTSDTIERTLIAIDADNEQIFLDVAVAYWPGGFGSQLNLFGYQYKEAEFKDGDLVTDFSYSGPMAGFNFRS